MTSGSSETGRRLFAPVNLQPNFNAGRQPEPGRWYPALESALAELPAGPQRFWGIPFDFGPAAETVGDAGDGAAGAAGPARCWVLLGGPTEPSGPAGAVTLPLDDGGPGGPSGAAPTYLLFVHICGLPAASQGAAAPPPAEALPDSVTRLGEPVADYVLVYGDDSEHRHPIRWRFEINGGAPWGQRAFAARPNHIDAPVDFRGPYGRNAWGHRQTSVQPSYGRYWVYALPNPHPDRPLLAVRLEPTGAAAVAVAALTRFYGADHPLRHHQLQSFRVTLPPAPASPLSAPERGTGGEVRSPTPDAIEASIDLGIIARKYAVPAFDPDAWLAGEGISQPLPRTVPAEPLRELILDITASADATLTVAGHDVPLRDAYERGAARSAGGAVRVEVLTPRKTWLHVTVEDAATGKPAPARIHFRAPDGRYLPPYGYRHEVNDNWFEDYGNDLKLHGTEYAYVDGTFQMEMPVGEVYVEVFKGFEHRPLRQKLTIQPGQRSLKLAADRPLDWRRQGWVTADTHVHFISPQTAWLQGQAEGLNLINLLASQWGDLFTNVGDISGGLSGVSRGETLVWVGTENRQHLLGHMSLLGIKGAPVFPMTTAGPSESYLGDPTWTTMAEWADEARRKDGVVVIPHFPNPYCEVAADIVLGKIDAVELNMADWTTQLHEYYRYLSCGYRVACVGGTDKMGAYMPVGAIRTYALLDDHALSRPAGAPFTFEAWAAAVRAGRTFTTTGPLLDITVEGRHPGDEIQLPAGGGTLHVEARAESLVSLSYLEVVMNGEVVAAERGPQAADARGTYTCRLSAPLHVPGSAWIAARCSSPMSRWIGSPRIVAAHTSPVYVVAGGEELFSPSDATYMLTLLEGGLTWLDTLSIPADPERHARNRQVFEDARAHLHQRLHARGRPHPH
jgi:hypothetical protein